ncbi:MAG TPA: RNA polymerase sigma factor [Thermoanaerobaculia bacterium]|jgi:RNA polymerase sigma-70 factor (ECF subfamily)|nr:RNA polymerase sigma factor [Thermoanaerobaculia bacterium]
MNSSWSDEQLVAEYRRAHPDARESFADTLFARYYERVARWCYRSTGDPDSARDLAQDVFLKAHRHLDSFQGTSRFGTWLYSIVRNESINRFRRSGPPLEDAAEALAEVPSLEAGPEQIATENSRARRLHTFLDQTLDEKERTVFTLHYGDDMPLDAITRLLGLENASGAKAYIVSARRKLSRAVERLMVRGERI